MDPICKGISPDCQVPQRFPCLLFGNEKVLALSDTRHYIVAFHSRWLDSRIMFPIPNEILSLIFSFVKCEGRDWLSILLVNKQWLSVGRMTLDPSVNNNAAIRWACREGKEELVRLLLLDPRVNPSDGGNSCIHFASAMGHLNIVRLLLADPRVDPSSGLPLCFACMNGHKDVVETLLEDPRADPSKWKLWEMSTGVRQLYSDVLVKIGKPYQRNFKRNFEQMGNEEPCQRKSRKMNIESIC